MDGKVIDKTAVLVSTVQDGTFANANIAMATGITTKATFINKTAVFKITPGAGNNTKYVEVITARPEIANVVPEKSEFTKLNKIRVNSTSEDAVYVSILVPEGLKVRDLSFADGSNIKTAKDITDAIMVNTISTVSNEKWNTPYVEIGGLKWATRNVGATNPEDYGKYFSWGDVTGQTWNGSAWSNGGFYNAPTISPANPDILPLEYDAAAVNWSGSWHMPSPKNYEVLFNQCYAEWEEYNNVKGLIVYKTKSDTDKGYAYIINTLRKYSGSGMAWSVITGKSKPSYNTTSDTFLFFPAAGNGTDGTGGNIYNNATHGGYYWSNTLTSDTSKAFFLFAGDNGYINPNGDSRIRLYGMSIRPVSD